MLAPTRPASREGGNVGSRTGPNHGEGGGISIDKQPWRPRDIQMGRRAARTDAAHQRKAPTAPGAISPGMGGRVNSYSAAYGRFGRGGRRWIPRNGSGGRFTKLFALYQAALDECANKAGPMRDLIARKGGGGLSPYPFLFSGRRMGGRWHKGYPDRRDFRYPIRQWDLCKASKGARAPSVTPHVGKMSKSSQQLTTGPKASINDGR